MKSKAKIQSSKAARRSRTARRVSASDARAIAIFLRSDLSELSVQAWYAANTVREKHHVLSSTETMYIKDAVRRVAQEVNEIQALLNKVAIPGSAKGQK